METLKIFDFLTSIPPSMIFGQKVEKKFFSQKRSEMIEITYLYHKNMILSDFQSFYMKSQNLKKKCTCDSHVCFFYAKSVISQILLIFDFSHHFNAYNKQKNCFRRCAVKKNFSTFLEKIIDGGIDVKKSKIFDFLIIF